MPGKQKGSRPGFAVKRAVIKSWRVFFSLNRPQKVYRGMDIHCWMPPAQIPAGVFFRHRSHPRHHDSSLEPARPIGSVPHTHHFRPLQIPIQDRTAIDTHRSHADGLVQPIFRPPSRRPTPECSPSASRRDAGLKCSALCIIILGEAKSQGVFELIENDNPTLRRQHRESWEKGSIRRQQLRGEGAQKDSKSVVGTP
jgi:hypothetical protein